MPRIAQISYEYRSQALRGCGLPTTGFLCVAAAGDGYPLGAKRADKKYSARTSAEVQ
jgi:hypothetical protein